MLHFIIEKNIEELKMNPLPSRIYDIKKLKRFQGDIFRNSLGDIRIVYTIDCDSKTIIVHFNGSRSHTYK